MAAGRMVCSAAVAALLLVPSAHAADVLVLQENGETVRRSDPGVAERGPERAPKRVTHRRERAERPRAGVSQKKRKRTVTNELRRLYDAGKLDYPTYRDRRAEYRSFKAAVPRFSGSRRTDMAGVLGIVEGIAARGQLTPSRLPALWLTMERNRQWWNEGPLLASGQRVSFEGSELDWQYVPGQGLAIHPLANFGKLNALWRAKKSKARMEALMDELLALPAARARGLAWEYYFDFGGGRPPWVSGLAQGTGLQALSRAAIKSGRADELMPTLRRGLGIFRTAPPQGVRVEAEHGIHYAQYSYAPGFRILNGFIQSLVGLYDFAANAGDEEALAMFAEGETQARAEVPTFDTGAWSLYSRGTTSYESNLNYHEVLRDFLKSLCDRTAEPVYCDTVTRFDDYLRQPPVLELVSRRLRGGRPGTLKFRLSKISRVTVRVSRRGKTVYSSSAILGYGLRRQTFQVPRKAGTYDVAIDAVGMAGNRASVAGSVKVLKPFKRR